MYDKKITTKINIWHYHYFDKWSSLTYSLFNKYLSTFRSNNVWWLHSMLTLAVSILLHYAIDVLIPICIALVMVWSFEVIYFKPNWWSSQQLQISIQYTTRNIPLVTPWCLLKQMGRHQMALYKAWSVISEILLMIISITTDEPPMWLSIHCVVMVLQQNY